MHLFPIHYYFKIPCRILNTELSELCHLPFLLSCCPHFPPFCSPPLSPHPPDPLALTTRLSVHLPFSKNSIFISFFDKSRTWWVCIDEGPWVTNHSPTKATLSNTIGQNFPSHFSLLCHIYFFNPTQGYIYWLERDRERQETEKHWSVASCMHPNGGWNSQPRYVPWLGIEPTTFWCTGRWHSNWATQPGPSAVFLI